MFLPLPPLFPINLHSLCTIQCANIQRYHSLKMLSVVCWWSLCVYLFLCSLWNVSKTGPEWETHREFLSSLLHRCSVWFWHHEKSSFVSLFFFFSFFYTVNFLYLTPKINEFLWYEKKWRKLCNLVSNQANPIASLFLHYNTFKSFLRICWTMWDKLDVMYLHLFCVYIFSLVFERNLFVWVDISKWHFIACNIFKHRYICFR